MNLNHLYYFRTLAQIQHYSQAASELYISQPNLTYAISSLEKELDVKLVQKIGRTVALTEEEKVFRARQPCAG